MPKRMFDLILSSCLIPIFLLPMCLIALAIKVTSRGPTIHWSKRIGKNNKVFLMPKFRTMVIETPQVATHLIQSPHSFLTPIGGFLRKSSMDELPQILSVWKGDMSFVGPRPALFNQQDLIELRTFFSIQQLRPGVTGWAQINGRDELPIPIKVEYDRFYKENLSFALDLKILIATLFKVFRADGVTH